MEITDEKIQKYKNIVYPNFLDSINYCITIIQARGIRHILNTMGAVARSGVSSGE